jgi:hypothetical protein
MYSVSHAIDGVEVVPGATWRARQPFSLDFNVVVRCVAVGPELFTGEVTLDGESLLTTQHHSTIEAAEREATKELSRRFRVALGG